MTTRRVTTTGSRIASDMIRVRPRGSPVIGSCPSICRMASTPTGPRYDVQLRERGRPERGHADREPEGADDDRPACGSPQRGEPFEQTIDHSDSVAWRVATTLAPRRAIHNRGIHLTGGPCTATPLARPRAFSPPFVSLCPATMSRMSTSANRLRESRRAPTSGLGETVGRALGTAADAATTDVRPVEPVAAVVATPRAALVRSRLPAVIALAGLAGFGALFALVRHNRTAAFDAAVTLRIQGARNRGLDRLMAAASWPGFPPQSRIIQPTIIGGLAAAGLRVEAVTQTLAWSTALLSTVIKSFMGRARPVAGTDLRVVAAPLGGSSFPSGHVLTYVGAYGFLAFLAATLVRPAALRRTLVAFLAGLIALVGPSRIQQGHHWPTDVSASYLLGTSYLVGVVAIYRRLKARRVAARP